MSDISSRMKTAWNSRARRDAYFYVETTFWNNDKAAFFALGEARSVTLIDPVLNAHGIAGAGATAIDLGCGVGRFTQALGRRFGTVIGLDVSEDMVTQARSAAHGLPGLSFTATDGMAMPLPDASADFIWSYEVFQHMPSHDVMLSNLREVARTLRPARYALLHFRTAHAYPAALWHIARLMPPPLMRALKQALGKDPLTADASWRGASPVSRTAIQEMCKAAALEIVEFLEDPTHRPGTRIFALLRRK
jgi:SAM-dependent methyltransferase